MWLWSFVVLLRQSGLRWPTHVSNGCATLSRHSSTLLHVASQPPVGEIGFLHVVFSEQRPHGAWAGTARSPGSSVWTHIMSLPASSFVKTCHKASRCQEVGPETPALIGQEAKQH